MNRCWRSGAVSCRSCETQRLKLVIVKTLTEQSEAAGSPPQSSPAMKVRVKGSFGSHSGVCECVKFANHLFRMLIVENIASHINHEISEKSVALR